MVKLNLNYNMITSIKVFKEVFKPYNLAGRQQELREQTIKMLGQEILNGDLDVESWMIDLDPSRIKVRKIVGNLECRFLDLTSLPAWFQSIEEVTGWFDCSSNQLTSLEGGPQTVGESFWCENNRLTSLEGGPQTVGWSFDCHSNKLTSLEGGPQTIGWSFDCHSNKLTSLEGLPKQISKDLCCFNNAKQFGETDIPSTTKIGGKIKFKS